jgi:hypothetical protein
VLHGTQQGLLRDPPLAHSQQEHLLSDHKSTQPHLYPAVPRLWVPGGRQDKAKRALGFWSAQESSNCGWKECLFLGEREKEKKGGRSRSLEVAVSISAGRQTEARICHNTTQELLSAISCSERKKERKKSSPRSPLSWELLNLACCNKQFERAGGGEGE